MQNQATESIDGVVGSLTKPWSRQRTWSRQLQRLQPYLYLAPALISIGIWIYWPLLNTVVLSFYQWNLLPTVPMVFVGLDNYTRVLALNEIGTAVRNTAIYIVGLLPFSVFGPLAVAMMVGSVKGRLSAIYRAIIFSPLLIAPVVVAIVWRWILSPLQGILNITLQDWFGFESIRWLADRELTIWVITAITGWKLFGFSMLIFSAGLTNINPDYLDAASVDGATAWQKARLIVLPLLSPTISFMVLLTVLLSAQWTFPLINVLTQGGPIDATTNVYYILWQLAFRSFNVGWSAAASVIFFAAFAVLAMFVLRLVESRSFYEE